MKTLTAVLLATFLGVSLLAQGPAVLFSSTAAMQAMMQTSSESKELVTGCTAFKINNEKRIWMTAEHCLAIPSILVLGEPIKLLALDAYQDLAVFTLDTDKGMALKLAPAAPTWGDDIATAGYPFGARTPFYFKGKLANPSGTSLLPTDRLFAWLDQPCGSGSSGSPVVNRKGQLVGVVQIGAGHSGFSAVCGAARWRDIRDFAGRFF